MNNMKIAAGIVAAIVALMILLAINPFVVINSGNKGMVFNWGAIQNDIMEPGLHFRMPIAQKVVEITTQPIQLDYTVDIGGSGAITKDNQTIGSDISTFYRYDDTKLVEMWNDYGTEKIESLVKTAVKESFKETVGAYTIFDIAQNQEKIRGEVWDRLSKKVSAYPIVVSEIRIQNYEWSDEFDKQIQATMNRAQQVKQAEQDLLLTQQNAQKQVKEAEAKKEALILEAEGKKEAARLDAEAKALAGEGLRKYNDSIRATVDIEIRLRELEIEKERIEKWNGEYVANNNYLPIPFNYGVAQGK